MLHYVDLASAAAQPINADLLRVIAKYIEVSSCSYKGQNTALITVQSDELY
jgi:hypothetical protein